MNLFADSDKPDIVAATRQAPTPSRFSTIGG